MLVLQYVEQKERVQGIKWGGLLPISSFGSQHCSGVVTGRACHAQQSACAHDRGPARTTKDLRARGGVCLGRSVATGFLGCSVAIERAHSVSRQRF